MKARVPVAVRRICMIALSGYPADPRIRKEAEALERNGWEVDLLCLPRAGQPRREEFGAVTVHRLLRPARPERIAGYFLLSLLFFAAAALKLQLLHARRKYAAVQVHNMPELLVFAALPQKLAGVPVVLDVHDLTPEMFRTKWRGPFSRLLLSLVILAEKASCRFADQVITVSEGCRSRLVARGVPFDKITLVLNTAESSRFGFHSERDYGQRRERAVVLYHGTVAERFGVHTVIEAFPAFLARVPGSVFLVFGKYDAGWLAHLRRRIEALHLGRAVFLNGGISLERARVLIGEADLGVVPYQDNEYMNLALSTKAFEYAASGLPMVATRLEALASIFPDEAVLWARGSDPRDWAEKMTALCLDGGRRAGQALRAREAVRRIEGGLMMERYTALIGRTALAGSRPGRASAGLSAGADSREPDRPLLRLFNGFRKGIH